MTKDDDDDPAMTAADRAVIDAARTGKGLRITSLEQLMILAEAARARLDGFETDFADMTIAQATFVRQLRCDQGYTWRAVAEACALEWGGDWGSNQLAGMALCARAALLFNEDPGAEPWN